MFADLRLVRTIVTGYIELFPHLALVQLIMRYGTLLLACFIPSPY